MSKIKDKRRSNHSKVKKVLLKGPLFTNSGYGVHSRQVFLALSQRKSPQETSALTKASSGAIEKLQIIELSNMYREIKKLQKFNFSIYGLAGEGENDVYVLENETGNVALVLGSEGKGLRRLTKENVDSLIKIPINAKSDSLNVSNAASVAMFQLQKNITKN